MPPRAAEAVAPAGQGGENGPQQRQQEPAWLGIVKMVAMWYFLRNFMMGKQSTVPPDQLYRPSVTKDTSLDISFYFTEGEEAIDVARPVWKLENIPWANTKQEVTKKVEYHPSKAVQNNETLYVHALLVESGYPLDPHDPEFDYAKVFHIQQRVNRYLPRPKRKEGINLLSGAEAEQHALAAAKTVADPDGPAEPEEIISFFLPNITFAMVDDFTAYPGNAVPPHVAEVLKFDSTTKTYQPILWLNDFWMLRDYLIPMNETVEKVPMHLSVYTLPGWQWQLFLQMNAAFKMQTEWGAMRNEESDEFKRILLEGNPYFLALTFAVSLLHTVFDMLAFKNDIGFWKNKKSVEGLSVRTILFNCACQLIILLYLLDNDTSMVVLFSSFLGLAIEFWKVTQAMNVTIDRSGPYPRIKFADKDSYKNSNTDQYDKEAMRYLSLALLPCVGGYAIYALLYETHKSWYSWIINSLVGAVYTFGFILMCPQLYLNYKLKSVAHLPWRQMTYKFLNTIIDDLFAFVIKMPWLHRLSVFRDDVVFLIYLYQRWIYRVDKSRANEFGYVEVDPDEAQQGAGDVVPAGETAEAPQDEAHPRGHSPSGSSDSFEDISKEIGPERENLRQRRGGDRPSGTGTSTEQAGPASRKAR
eukprot:jgi/Botrbrau1/9279/Bobra.0111s0007.1